MGINTQILKTDKKFEQFYFCVACLLSNAQQPTIQNDNPTKKSITLNNGKAKDVEYLNKAESSQ